MSVGMYIALKTDARQSYFDNPQLGKEKNVSQLHYYVLHPILTKINEFFGGNPSLDTDLLFPIILQDN